MQINLPDETRLKFVAKKLNAALEVDHGIKVTLSQCRDVVSRMFGFEGYNHFLYRNLSVGLSFWDEDQQKGIATLRRSQYIRALVEEKIKKLDAKVATAVVDLIGPTSRPVPLSTDAIYLGSTLTAIWSGISSQAMDAFAPLLKGLKPQHGDRFLDEAGESPLYKRLLVDSHDLKSEGYSGYSDIVKIRDADVYTVLVAVPKQVRYREWVYITVGHVSFKTYVEEQKLFQRFEVVQRQVDNERLSALGYPEEMPEFVQAGLMHVVAWELGGVYHRFWKPLGTENGTLTLEMAPELSRWDDISWPLRIVQEAYMSRTKDKPRRHVGFTDEDRQFAGHRVETQNQHEPRNRLPQIARRYLNETERGAVEAASHLITTRYRDSMMPAPTWLRVNPAAKSIEVVALMSGELVGIGEAFTDHPEPKHSSLKRLVAETLETASSFSVETITALAGLCDGRTRLLGANPHILPCPFLCDEKTLLRGEWDTERANVFWLEQNAAVPPPSVEYYYHVMIGLLGHSIRKYPDSVG